MKKFLCIAVFAFIGSWVFSQEPIIAVFPFEDMENVLTRNDAKMFYQEFSNEFKNRMPEKSVVPREDVDRLIRTEFNFQLSVFSAQEKTAEMNKVLNGNQILHGLIGRLDNKIRIIVSLYTYPDLDRLPGGTTLIVANKTELFNKIPELVRNMQNEITGKRSDASKTYKIGDYGPAGGIVFYDKGVFSGGWRYLEAAPVETEFRAAWGAYERDVTGTATVVGSGKRNTQIIIDRLKQLNENDRAAQLCVGLNFDGFNDWFLPSRDELDLMYKNLKQKGLGSFGSYISLYWSSTQASNRDAWGLDFDSGQQMYDYLFKRAPFAVRAIRAF